MIQYNIFCALEDFLMNNYIIRNAQIKDWPTLLLIFDKSLRSIEQYEKYSEEDYKQFYKCLMNHSFPLYDIYVYIIDNNILGFICYHEHKIEMLYVLPQYMNNGIGSTLLEYVLDKYHETLEIGVSKTNPVSMHIYQKHGFVVVRTEDYDVSGVYCPHYIMVREYK